ncbi:hypothetical protein PHMEG_00027559 [Phytophthora megakarya]|uniref:Uncharacterized protein n=1 Tax=Phytophthora megakarya TaxID=4795 RepID=A0A225V743_9STRA|nr:hypothetical protein PHMEG_00027559 [Phytophthora megakarya]
MGAAGPGPMPEVAADETPPVPSGGTARGGPVEPFWVLEVSKTGAQMCSPSPDSESGWVYPSDAHSSADVNPSDWPDDPL